jgi:PAS domain S-box-containing protein
MSANTPHHSRFFWRSSAMFCLLDSRIRFTEINSAWEKSLELSTGQLLTKSFLDFIHPEDRPATQYYFEQLGEGMVATTFSVRFRHRNGAYRQLLWEMTASASPEKEYSFYGVALDITGRERPSIADEMVSVLPQGIVLQYANGTIGACNASAEKIIGLPADEMIGWTLVDPEWELLREDHSPFPSEAHPAICALRTGQPQTEVIIGVQKNNGSVFWLRMNAVPLWRDDVTTPYAVVISFSDVTHFKTTEIALRQQSEQRPTGGSIQEAEYDFWNWDLNSNQISLSPAWKQMLGYEDSALVNHIDSWHGRIHPVDYKRVLADIHNHLEGLTPQFENTHRLQHRDGSYRWVLAKGTAVRDNSGKPVRMVGVHVDITEQRRLDERLQELQNKYAQLLETEIDAILLVDAKEPGKEKILEANKAASLIYGYSRNELLDRTLSDLSAQSEKTVKAARKLSKQTRQRYHRKKDETVFPAEVSTNPFVLQGRELAFIKIRDNSEKQNIETALWESQSKYRQLFEASNTATIVFDANTQRVFDVNNVAVEIYGYTKDEWLNLTTENISAEPSKARAALYSGGNKKQFIPLRWHKKKDGTVFPVEISIGNTYLFQGRSLVCANLRDITERKSSEEALRKERDFVNTLVQASPAFFFAVNPDGKIRMMNDAMLKALRYTLDVVIEQSYIHMLVPENEQAMVSAEFENLAKSMRPSMMETQVLSKDGRSLKVEWHSRAIVQADGTLDYIFGVGIDITERLRTQEDLRLFKAIIESSEEAISISNRDGQLVYVNPAHEKLFGQPLAEACAHNRDYYPEESQEVINREVIPALQRGESWTGELEVNDAQDNTFPVWQRADAVRDAKGAIMFTFELMHNISERKRMWETLRSQWEEYQLIFNNVPIMIWHMDRDNRVLRANRMASDSFPDERTVLSFFDDNAEIIHSGQPDYRKLSVYTDSKDANLWLDTGRIPYRNAEGEIIGLIFFAIDITSYREHQSASHDAVDTLLSKLPVFVAAFDVEGKIIEWNQTATRLSGYSAEEACADSDFVKKIFPDAELRQKILDVASEVRALETLLPCKDGSLRTLNWYNLSCQLPVPAWHTWLIGTENGLLSSKADALLPYIFDHASLGICLTDDRGRFVQVNRAYAKMFGFTPEELAGQPFTAVLPSKRHDDAIREYFSMLITHEEPLMTKQLGNQHRVSGEYFDLGIMTNRVILKDGRRLLITIQTKLPEDFF